MVEDMSARLIQGTIRRVSGVRISGGTPINYKEGINMRLRNIAEIEAFREAINEAKNDVWLESPNGDRYNLKSELSQYLALGTLLSEKGEMLDLYCSRREDEHLFMRFFEEYPDTI